MSKDIKVLVLVTDYPDLNGNLALMYVHTRNVFYSQNRINVTVLNFTTNSTYEIDGIKVLSLADFEKTKKDYDILISHAPNLRNHYRFLLKYGDLFSNFIFFFHGHEVLKINETYSKPYDYVRTSKVKNFTQNIYDDFKLYVWRKYFTKVRHKSKFVFVSKWMLEEFLKWTKIPFDLIKENSVITYNCIGKAFEETSFDYVAKKEFDFLTLRSFLDGSKYCIDVINNLAYSNPSMKFLIVGKGEFFSHYEKAPNIVWLNQTMNHQEIVSCMQKSRCALMPTRTDAQGLMMCEMASTGMPLITSDIPVSHEVFDDFDNVAFINIDKKNNLNEILYRLESKSPYKKSTKYYNIYTSQKEVELILNIAEL